MPERNARPKDRIPSWGLKGGLEMEPGTPDPHVVKKLVEPLFATLVLVVVVVAVKVLTG